MGLAAQASVDESRIDPASFELAPDEARARFRWASRRGHPRWLWPEVEVAAWSQALEQIAAVTREVMTAGRSPTRLDGPPAAVGVAAYTSGMGPMLGHWREAGQVDCSPPVADLLALHLAHNRARMDEMAERTRAVSRALAGHGVAHTLLKGMHTAFAYFPEPGLRPLADLDLLVAERDKLRAGDVLHGCGYIPGVARAWPPEQLWRPADSPAEPRSLDLVHADDPWTIDLHTSLNRRLGAGSPVIRLDEAVDRPLARSSLAPDAAVLPQPALLVHLALHAGCELISLTLVRLVELALVVRRDTDRGTLRWDEYLTAAGRAGALAGAWPALKLGEELVPGTVPAEVLAQARRQVPAAVLRVVDPLSPADAHMVMRCSLAERFMWAPSRRAIARQALDEIFPPGSSSLATLAAIYRTRVMRLARRTLTR